MVTRNSRIRTRPQRVLAAVSACTLLVVGFVASINLAAPSVASSSLHPSSEALLWIVDLYVVVFACLVIPAGALGDRLGRRDVAVAGLVTFAIGALISAASPEVTVMLVGRAVTGVGAAMVLPNGLALIVHATEAEHRPRAIAVWASMTGIGGVVGNVGGGAILSAGSWRWLFLTVVPIALAVAAWLRLVAPFTERRDEPMDFAGAVVLTLATVATLLAIIEGPKHGWTSALVLSMFTAAVVLLAGWVLVELRSAHPMLDPRLLAMPALRSASLGMLVLFFGMFGLFYLNASLLQYGRGFTTLQTGLAIVPLSLPLLIAARYVPALVRRCGEPATLAFAFITTGAGLFGLASATQRPYIEYALWLVLVGVGIALALPTLTGSITANIPRAQAGVAGGLQSTTREMGSALGVAVLGTLAASRFSHIMHSPSTLTVARAFNMPSFSQPRVIAAYDAAAGATMRVAAIVVLAAGFLVVADIATAGKRRPASTSPQ